MLRIPEEKKDFEQLFKEYYPSMVLYTKRFVEDLDTARDIAQQVFVNIYEKRDRLNISSSVKSYLFQAARNTALNYLEQKKNQQKHKDILQETQAHSTEHESDIENSELSKRLYEMIEELPPKCRQIFKMNRFEGKKNKEIAEELDISIRTVETQISKALRALREKATQVLGLLLLIILKNLF